MERDFDTYLRSFEGRLNTGRQAQIWKRGSRVKQNGHLNFSTTGVRLRVFRLRDTYRNMFQFKSWDQY